MRPGFLSRTTRGGRCPGDEGARRGRARRFFGRVDEVAIDGRPVWGGRMALGSESLLPMIQLAITPVILITGLGSLLLTMTNRLGRIVDRTRILAGQARVATEGEERAHIESQLRILFHRAGLVRMAVSLAATSMFVSGLLVVAIFLSALLRIEAGFALLGLFVAAIALLLGALVYLLRDINKALHALGLEVRRVLPGT